MAYVDGDGTVSPGEVIIIVLASIMIVVFTIIMFVGERVQKLRRTGRRGCPSLSPKGWPEPGGARPAGIPCHRAPGHHRSHIGFDMSNRVWTWPQE